MKQDVPDNVRGISIANQGVPSTFSTTPRCYGNVAISREELVYSNINIADCEAQVEKGLAKYRWSVRNNVAQEDGGDEERTSYRASANEFDFRYMRATDLPFNQRITLLKSVNENTELKMQNMKEDLKKDH